jgi:hypothetical protein
VFFSANDVNDIDDADEWEPRKKKKEPKPGLATTSRTRPKMIENLQRTLSDFGVTIRSIRLLNELKVFIWQHSDKCGAQSGFNDDLVMALTYWSLCSERCHHAKRNAVSRRVQGTEFLCSHRGNLKQGL